MADFGTIRPGDIDTFVFDFAKEIGGSGTITDADWLIAVSDDSINDDADVADRLITLPAWTPTQTSIQAGQMLDGVTYTLTATVTLNDGRVLSESGEVECVLEPPITIPVLNVEKFRHDLPVFADESVFTNDMIQFWVDIVINDGLFPASRWGNLQLLGQELFIAHQIILERQSMLVVTRGGVPLTTGVPSSKSVGGVSISYDTRIGIDADAGYWALTPYGMRLHYLMRDAGAGPIQL